MKFVYEESATRADALRELCELWSTQLGTSIVPLDEACGRVTAEDVHARCTLPVVRSSKRDGIAVRSADFADGLPDTSSWQRGRDYAQADTGDDFPDEFDMVIAVEDIAYDESGALMLTGDAIEAGPGAGVNPAGSIVHEGDVAVAAHTVLTPELVASLAVAGHAQVRVLDRPRVAYIPTGSELVPWGTHPQRGQNIEANGLMVAGMVEQWGARCVRYPIVRDDPAALEEALDRALEAADIVLINGGSSRGEEDYNSHMLKRRGSHFRHGVRAVPGRPVGMALIEGTPVVNVPGPVMAAFLCMDWLIRGLVAHAQGLPVEPRRQVRARLVEAVRKPQPFERIVRVQLADDNEGGWTCRPVPNDIGTVATLRESDAVLTLPIGSTGANAGDEVTVELLSPIAVIEQERAGQPVAAALRA